VKTKVLSLCSFKTIERFVDYLRTPAIRFLIKRLLQSPKLVFGEIAVSLIIGAPHFNLIGWIPINPGSIDQIVEACGNRVRETVDARLSVPDR
jgi:hypothetical protein